MESTVREWKREERGTEGETERGREIERGVGRVTKLHFGYKICH